MTPLGRAPKGPELDLFMKEFLIDLVSLNFGFSGLPARGGPGSGVGRVVCCLGACLALFFKRFVCAILACADFLFQDLSFKLQASNFKR